MSFYGAPGTIQLSQMGHGMPMPPPVSQRGNDTVFRYGEQSIWSSQFLGGATAVANQSFRLFSTQLGQVGQGFTAGGLSIAETNLKLPGQVPGGVAYDVFGVACQVLHASAATDAVSPGTLNQNAAANANVQDLLNILNNGVFSWDFTQTQVDIAPLMLIGQGGGAFGAVSTTANATTVGHMNNSAGEVWLYRQYPVALPGTTVFGMLLRFGNRAAAIGQTYIVIRCVLLGYYKNLVEIG